jgi:sarcosine oxidase subunit delta
MLLIECPYCGPRDETDFKCGGEAHITRPEKPADTDDQFWGDYLFMRANPMGTHYEMWCHSHGCRRWFNVCRDTLSNKIHAVYKMGEPPPEVDNPTRSRSR